MFFFFFFFQAEDGIRDTSVTGVQTCALPISYHCSFCCIQAPFKSGEAMLGLKESVNSYRFWSPQFIAGQLELLVQRHGVRHVKIADEMFVLNMKHVNGICDLLIERGLELNIWAYARVDTVRGDEKVKRGRRAGFTGLAFADEAA